MPYRHFRIRKRSGGDRLIEAPDSRLKARQRTIAMSLLSRKVPHPAATAFVKGASILRNASPHAHAQVVLSIDLSSFFWSITTARVTGLFRAMGYGDMSLSMARDCTYRGRLPMGSPASPVICNLIAYHMDVRLSTLAARYGLAYTRYADDITISGNELPDNLLPLVVDVITGEGFTVNASKVHIQHRGDRHLVTGLIVGDRPRVRRSTYRAIRAAVHSAVTSTDVQRARGLVAFLHMIEPEKAAKLRSRYEWL